MSDYFKSAKAMIKSGKPITKYDEYEYCVYDEEKEVHLRVSYNSVEYKGYKVPLNESDVEDLHTLISLTYSSQEEKNKKEALKQLLGEK